MLADTRNIAAGENEEILSNVVHQLIRLAQDPEETGQIFRERHAKMAIKETCAERQGTRTRKDCTKRHSCHRRFIVER